MADRAELLPLYFGCWGNIGHHFYRPGGASVREHYKPVCEALGGLKVDGGLNPSERQSEAAVIYHDGLTALAMADRTVDGRGGSNSVFIFEGRHTFAQMCTLAAAHFGPVWHRINDYAEVWDTAAGDPNETKGWL